MKPVGLCCAAALVLLLCGKALAQRSSSEVEIRVKGADTIGELLGKRLTAAYQAEHRGASIDWESVGSGTAFVGLLDGSADIGASSRPISGEELAEARRLGVALSEHVIGYDGVAVIVHSSNPLEELSFEQLADLFTGRTPNWSALGGRNLPIYAISLPTYSGTHVVFHDAVMRSGQGEPEKFSAETVFIEESRDLVRQVARDRRSISYVGLGFVNPEKLKAVAVAAPGQPPVRPTEATIRSGAYPLSRPLYLYTRGEPSGPVRELIELVLSPKGQALIAQSGLMAVGATVPLPADAGAAAAAAVPQAPIRISFGHRSTQIGRGDRRALDELLEPLIQGNQRAIITGHADGVYPRDNNLVYSRDRAEVVAAYLRDQGVAAERIEIGGRAETQPVTSNRSDAGRSANRRVDVRLVPMSAGDPPPVGSAAKPPGATSDAGQSPARGER